MGFSLLKTALGKDGVHRVEHALLSGIKERFGEDIHERLEREGQVQIVWPNSSNPDVEGAFTWMLTKEVCLQQPS